MNKILIFAGAQESKLLIKQISENYLNLGEFHIIYEDEEIKKGFEQKENLFFYKIDFFAYEAYKDILRKDFNKVIILIKNRRIAQFVYKKVKHYKYPILLTKFWLDFDVGEIGNNIEILDIPQITANKIIDFLPNVPLYARDIGLGIGEIMEVEVPPHSPFAYKSKNIFRRYGVNVCAIYRNNELKDINKTPLILPNDKLILIGDPNKLKEIFTQIKSNVGSFPQPYGQNIYLLLDMKNMHKKEIYQLLKTGIFLHRKLKNKKLIIRIINPSLNSKIYKLYKFSNIDILTDFYETNYFKTLKKDNNKMSIGLFITNNKFFYSNKEAFFELKKPILKKGEESIKKCESLSVILNDKYVSRIAPVIFDLSYQLDLKVTFYDVDPENTHEETIEYLKMLAKNFNFSKVEFIKSKENPVFLLQRKEKICLIEAFSKIPPSVIRQVLFPKIEFSYIMLNKFNQFLIPIKEEYESNN